MTISLNDHHLHRINLSKPYVPLVARIFLNTVTLSHANTLNIPDILACEELISLSALDRICLFRKVGEFQVCSDILHSMFFL